MKKEFVAVVAVILTVGFMGGQAVAEQFDLAGKPFNLYGYLTQDIAVNMKNDKDNYDAVRGIQAALMTFLVEANYEPTPTLKIAASGKLMMDWAYQLNSDRDEWEDKQFDRSKKELNVDDEYWQLLNEAHVTWTPGPFIFRAGKQLVQWGEAAGVSLLNQINPLDTRRAFGNIDVELLSIPIWLLRSEYYPRLDSTWLQSLGFEFIFNPNADFIPTQLTGAGNDAHGIWGVNIAGPNFVELLPGTFIPAALAPPGLPILPSRIGSGPIDMDEPSEWDSEGFEYGARIKGIVDGTILTLNYFYGLDKMGVQKADMSRLPVIEPVYDGTVILHSGMTGKYPRMRFIGFTALRDFPSIRSSLLGGVSPVGYIETFYGFDHTFTTGMRYVKSDEFRTAIGCMWKVQVPFLNPKQGITVSPQWYWQRIMDYDNYARDGDVIATGKKNNYQTSIMLMTQYMNCKLTPSIFWLKNWTGKGDMYNVSLKYDYTYNWAFTLGAVYMGGQKPGQPFELFENKSNVFFKIAYKWG